MSREWGYTLARSLERIEGNTASGIVLEDLTVVRSHDDGCTTLLGEAVQELGDSQAILCIEVPRRLVGEDELGTTDEGAGDGDTLLLTAREFVGILIALCLKADILERLVDEALAFAASADTEGAQYDIEVVMHGLVGQELEVLEDDAKAAT